MTDRSSDEEIARFIEWLAQSDVVLARWSAAQNELMPIQYNASSIIKRFRSKGRVRGIERD